MKKTWSILPLIAIVMVSCTTAPSAKFSIECGSMDDAGYPQIGEKIKFINHSENSDSYYWDFGDGNTSTDENPSHQYDEAGLYIITCQAQSKFKTSTGSSFINVVSIDGNWLGYIEINGTTLPVNITLKQDDDDFEGEFKFSDESGFSDVDKGSLNENDIEFEVTINYSVGNNVFIEFEGEITPQFSNMAGKCKFNRSATGTWALYRDASKNAFVSYKNTLADSLCLMLK